MKDIAATSFRDPEGFCCEVDGRILRWVLPEAAGRVQQFLAGAFFKEFFEEGHFPRTRLLGKAEGEEAGLKAGVTCHPEGIVLEHDRIPFPSYAYEWCPEMLYAAGKMTLRLQAAALEGGLTLKDATPDNVLFENTKPVFVDLLSFERSRAGGTLWPAYGQFIRTFLLPLVANRKWHTSLAEVFLPRRDGLEPEEVYDRCSWAGRFSPDLFAHTTLAAWFGRSASSRGADLRNRDRPQDPERARFVARTILRRLERVFRKSAAPGLRSSKWSNYAQDNTYPPEALATKERFVQSALGELKPRRVLDVGCNTGRFSRMAASSGAEVVAIDLDPVAVGRLWVQASSSGQAILPLVVNLARPSPGLGWRNQEQTPFLKRAQNHFDVVFLLAVIHHLAITDGIPLDHVFQLMHELGPASLIVENPGPADPMVVGLSANKEHLPGRLCGMAFERAFAPYFEAVRSEKLPGMDRTLFWLGRRD